MSKCLLLFAPVLIECCVCALVVHCCVFCLKRVSKFGLCCEGRANGAAAISLLAPDVDAKKQLRLLMAAVRRLRKVQGTPQQGAMARLVALMDVSEVATLSLDMILGFMCIRHICFAIP
jgi:hypothetical protein